jgi:hypothetical protein
MKQEQSLICGILHPAALSGQACLAVSPEHTDAACKRGVGDQRFLIRQTIAASPSATGCTRSSTFYPLPSILYPLPLATYNCL